MNFQNLIGKQIKHLNSGEIFTPKELITRSVIGSYEVVPTISSTDPDDGYFYFDDEFDDHFEVLHTTWKERYK